jgi:cellulose synthase/poly-beta-1,6-N-acetylglucosamine synthase-like glycosyltransferase
MYFLLDLPLLVLAICAALPSLWFLIECVLGALYHPRARPKAVTQPHPQVAILMPAHNESAGIEKTIRALQPQLNETTQLWVVADNCTDNTAQLAAASAEHVRVVERSDPQRRGKGYALAYGLDQLAQNPPSVVVILDADCELSEHGITALARDALTFDAPIQADYVLLPSTHPSPRSVVSALAFLVKNRVRPRGLAALGMPCLLTGTGMAFPWPVLRKAPPTDDNLVEDMVMGLELAKLGHAPRMCPDVCVTSALPEGEKTASAQRTRWEHGHLATLKTHVPQLMLRGLNEGRIDLCALALELLVPPLSLLVLGLAAGWIVCAIAAMIGGSDMPLRLFTFSLLSIAVGVLAGWLRYGRELVRPRDLLSIPMYVLWKLPLYFSFFSKGKQQSWERTERSDASVPPSSKAP